MTGAEPPGDPSVLDCIDRRRSCRAFRPAPPGDEALVRLLEAMRRAPSAGNLQPWHFYVVKRPGLRQALASAALGQRFIAQAPVVIVICSDALRSASRYGSRGAELYSVQDTAAAATHLLLAAEALGLGACWVGAFGEEEVVRALDLRPGHRPLALIPLGWPAEQPPRTSRRPLAEVVTFLG